MVLAVSIWRRWMPRKWFWSKSTNGLQKLTRECRRQIQRCELNCYIRICTTDGNGQ